jgi:hypothetical protein
MDLHSARRRGIRVQISRGQIGGIPRDVEWPLREGSCPFLVPKSDLSCDPPEAESALTDTLKQIRKERDRPLFVLVSQFIDHDVYRLIYECRRSVKGCSKGEGFDILIDSPGGDLQACYLIARLFARCTNSWHALVPRLAASGVTLISLGRRRKASAWRRRRGSPGGGKGRHSRRAA